MRVSPSFHYSGEEIPRDQNLRRLYRLASKVEFCAGKTIFSEGERAASTFGLAQDYVRLYKNTPDGRRKIVAFARPGQRWRAARGHRGRLDNGEAGGSAAVSSLMQINRRIPEPLYE